MTEPTTPTAPAQRGGWRLRFVVDDVESDFQRWRADGVFVPMVVGGAVAAVTYLGILAVLAFALRSVFDALVVPLGLLSVAIVTGLTWVSTGDRRHHASTVASGLTLLSGMTVLWATVILGQFAEDGLVGVLGYGLTFFVGIGFYAALMRLPPGRAVIGIAPPAIGFAVVVVGLHLDGRTHVLQMAFGHFGAAAAVGSAVGFGLLQERQVRRVFADERLIAEQSDALVRAAAAVRRYVPPAVADHIFAGREEQVDVPVRRRVTVLFSDLAGFTQLADRVEPEVLTHVLNEYMGVMADLVEEHHGTLNEFAGDGIMALFGAPDPLPPEEHAVHAVRAATAMHACLPELNRQWRRLGLGTDLRARIGINTGMVSVGSYGSEGRRTYTAIGLQTNLAARIESEAPPGTTLVSETTWQLVRDVIDCEPMGQVECKGIHYPVPVLRPVSTG